MSLAAAALRALAAGLLAATLAACGADDAPPSGSTAQLQADERQTSVIWVAGDESGPWGSRTQGLVDGAKLAILDAGGLVGERSVSISVVPAVQRDGNEVSAAISASRILRDSRALGVISTWDAQQLEQAAPLLNGGEIALLQYGSGMVGLTSDSSLRGEPARYEPSGRRLALLGVPSDDEVAAAVARVPDLTRPRIIALDDADPTAVTGADRLARTIARRARGNVVGGEVAPSDAAGSAPVVLVVGARVENPGDAVASYARRARGPFVVVDVADRSISASAVAGRSAPTYRVRRSLADASTDTARQLRQRELQRFGRDRGDAVVAGYRAAKLILDTAASTQVERSIDRWELAKALAAPTSGAAAQTLPVGDGGDVRLGAAQLQRLSGGSWQSIR